MVGSWKGSRPHAKDGSFANLVVQVFPSRSSFPFLRLFISRHDCVHGQESFQRDYGINFSYVYQSAFGSFRRLLNLNECLSQYTHQH
jgi:hypothetical protein